MELSSRNPSWQRSPRAHQQTRPMGPSDPIRPPQPPCSQGAVPIWMPAFALVPPTLPPAVCYAPNEMRLQVVTLALYNSQNSCSDDLWTLTQYFPGRN